MNSHNKVIPYFPIGCPDELLYSMCATFQDHIQFPKPQYVVETLFGYKWAHATYNLPNRLDYLVSNLPPGCNYTIDKLIDNHTMLPLYSPFCPQERIQYVREAMHQSGKTGCSIYSRLGILSIERLKFLRFCPFCVKEDIALFNEPYWHRVHQAPGVEGCPIHAVFLETSCVPVRNSPKHYSFVSAREGTFESSPRFLESDNRNHRILLQIARDVDWILSRGNSTSNLEQVHKRYKNILASKGLATHRATVSHRGELIN